jgi:hypothetical protein
VATTLDLPADGETSYGNKLRTAITTVRDVADAAFASSQVSVSGMPGIVFIDNFKQGSEVPGSTVSDDTLLSRALSYAKTQTYIPAVCVTPNTPRLVTFTQSVPVNFPGFKICGVPWTPVHWQNPEVSGGFNSVTRVRLNCGINGASWLVASATTINGAVSNIAFDSSNGNTQFAATTAGDFRAWSFHNLSFQAFKHVLGNPTQAFATTLCSITGVWNMTTALGMQCYLIGSDNDFWVAGSCNIGPSGNGSNLSNGEYLMRFGTSKTNYGGIYFTNDDNWRCLQLAGDMRYQAGNRLKGLRLEGRNMDDPAVGAAVRISGGGWSLDGCDLNYGMTNPSAITGGDRGMIHITGGEVSLNDITIDHANGLDKSTTNVVFISGGEVGVSRFKRGTKSGSWGSIRPRVQQTTAGLVAASDYSVNVVTAA